MARKQAGGPAVEYVTVNGEECRVWRKGAGPALGFLAGFGGLPNWIPFLDRLAERFEVIVPAIPGYPGGLGHQKLEQHIDWILAVRDLLNRAGLEEGQPRLVGSGPGGSFAAEIAVFWPHKVHKLALIAPWGLFDEAAPMTDPWGQNRRELPALLCERPERWQALTATPEGANSVEWPIEQARALEASARAFWPLANTRLERRLPRVLCPTLLIWGERDRVLPRSYADTFMDKLSGETSLTVVPGAGHLAELDAPEAVADVIAEFMA